MMFLRQKHVINSLMKLAPADKLCKQLGPRSGPNKVRAQSGSKLFDTLMVFVKDFLKLLIFNKKISRLFKYEEIPSIQSIKNLTSYATIILLL